MFIWNRGKPSMFNWKKVGEFTLTSGDLIAQDPCFKQKKPKNIIRNCAVGTWEAMVGYEEDMPMALAVHAVGTPTAALKALMTASCSRYFKPHSIVDVEAGQAGFYDAAHFFDDSVIDPGTFTHDFSDWDHPIWYLANCDKDLSADMAGVIPYGAVSSSGYGDGGYQCYVHRLKGVADTAYIIFC